MNGAAEILIRDYSQAIGRAAPAADLDGFLHDDIRQVEFPSHLNPEALISR